MDISTLKEYININRRRLSPNEADCSDPSVYKGFADTVYEIKELHGQVTRFYSETKKGGQESFRFGDVSVCSFLLMSSPMLLAAPKIGEQIFGDQGGAAIGYFLTLAILIVRIFLQGFVSHFRVASVGQLLRIALLVVCGYLHIFKQATFFGTTGIWVFVYIIFGSLITLFIRSFDIKRVKVHQAEFAEFSKKVDKLEALSAGSVHMYNKLADKAEAVLEGFIKNKGLNITPTKRSVWFSFERDPDNLMWGNKATVAFKAPFEEKREQKLSHRDFRDSTDEHGRGFYKEIYRGTVIRGELQRAGTLEEDELVTVQIYINSQEFGWADISGQEAKKLLDEGKIYPYYGMEIPEFLPQLRYCFFRHYYDITIVTDTDTTGVESVPVHSKAQDEFLRKTNINETLYHYDEARKSDDLYTKQRVEKYEEEKAAVYRSLCDYEEKTFHHHNKKSENQKAKEIGGLLVFAPDGELVGVYAGDTEQSLDFVSKEIKKYTAFVPNIYSQPFGYTQMQAMRRTYLS